MRLVTDVEGLLRRERLRMKASLSRRGGFTVVLADYRDVSYTTRDLNFSSAVNNAIEEFSKSKA